MTAFYQIEVTCEAQAYAVQQLIQSTMRRAQEQGHLGNLDDKTNAILAERLNYVGDDTDWELRKSDFFGK